MITAFLLALLFITKPFIIRTLVLFSFSLAYNIGGERTRTGKNNPVR